MRSLSTKERKKVLEQKQKEEERERALIEEHEICWHCSHKVWRDYFENRDPDGVPITLNCKFKEGNILRRTPACENFIKE